MRLQCAFCKHICCNPEYDEMLDCELALEETGRIKCCGVSFHQFELETDEKICQSYLNAFAREYNLHQKSSNNKSYDYDIPFENFMSSAKEEWDDRPRT